MSEKRVFKKDYLGELKVLAEEAGRTDLVEFCDKEIGKLANRKVAQTKNQKDNEVINNIDLEEKTEENNDEKKMKQDKKKK